MQIGTTTMENSMEFPKKIKMELPYDPVIPLLRILVKKPEHWFERIYASHVGCSIIYNSQDLEAAQVQLRWADKTNVVHLHSRILLYLAVEVKEIFPFVTAWMDLETIIQSEISQSEKDKYHMVSLIYRI